MRYGPLILNSCRFYIRFGGSFMSANIIYVRFGLRTCCYCCGKPFTPKNRDTVLCPDCPPEKHLVENALQVVEVDTVNKLAKTEQ
jgi:hypothetical protein